MPTASPSAEHRLLVVAHTHWDREWYHAAPRFRQRLVALVDALLEQRADPARPFLLDGQAVVLADYLAVRPEAASSVARHLASGALEAGPWFVLADTLIPCGEALVRNLEAGRRWLARLGAVAPPVAWSPDAFGHPAALPTVAAGFGLTVAVVWRGYGGPQHPAGDTAWWRAPGGDEVLLHHLPPDGYEFGSALPTDAAAMAVRWVRLRDALVGRAATPVLLLTAGADHHAADPALDRAVRALARAAAPRVAVERASLAAWAGALRRAADGRAIPQVTGELRDSRGHTWALPGTLATRAHQKRRNARLERALLHDVEPWEALAWLHAGRDAAGVAPDGRLGPAQAPALLAHAWETLLRTHPHDTLCGCSIDAVARAMDGRQAAVRAMVPGLRDALLAAALGHDPVQARARAPRDPAPVVVRNRSAHPRGGVAELRLRTTVVDVAVGPGSARQSNAPPTAIPVTPPAAIPAGAIVQWIGARLRHDRRESPQHYPDDDLVREDAALVWVPPVPAHGLRVLRAGDTVPPHAPPTPVTVSTDAAGAVHVDNGHLSLRLARDGITLRALGRTLPDLVRVDSTLDAGDSYTPSLRGEPEPLRITGVQLRQQGPLRAAVRVRWTLPAADGPHVPGDVAATAGRVAVRRGRRGPVRVDGTFVVDADASVLRVDLHVVNQRRDHRLRFAWRTGIAADHVLCDAAFGPVWRRVGAPSDAPADAVAHATPGTPVEHAPPTMPLHRWCAAFDGAPGATLLSDGLAEGEPVPDGVAVTLCRAIGELSRRDLPERPGHAGWPAAIPMAQSQGRWRARLGLLLHGPDTADTRDAIERAADDLLLPLVGESWRDYAGTATTMAGVALEGTALRATAVSRALTGDAIRLRAVNVSEAPASGAWVLPDEGPWESARCRLDETPLAPWVRHGSRLAFTAAPGAVVTHCVRRAAP